MVDPSVTSLLTDILKDASALDMAALNNAVDAAVANPAALDLSGVSPGVATGVADVLGEMTIMDLATYLASAAAGALSQFPRIAGLRGALSETRDELQEERAKVELQLEELQHKLATMDQELEQQSERFKQQYDAEMKIKLDQTVAKIQADYEQSMQTRMEEFKYNLEQEIKTGKSDLMAESSGFVQEVNEKSQKELALLQQQNERMRQLNAQLERAVQAANQEMVRLNPDAAGQLRTAAERVPPQPRQFPVGTPQQQQQQQHQQQIPNGYGRPSQPQQGHPYGYPRQRPPYPQQPRQLAPAPMGRTIPTTIQRMEEQEVPSPWPQRRGYAQQQEMEQDQYQQQQQPRPIPPPRMPKDDMRRMNPNHQFL